MSNFKINNISHSKPFLFSSLLFSSRLKHPLRMRTLLVGGGGGGGRGELWCVSLLAISAVLQFFSRSAVSLDPKIAQLGSSPFHILRMNLIKKIESIPFTILLSSFSIYPFFTKKFNHYVPVKLIFDIFKLIFLMFCQ